MKLPNRTKLLISLALPQLAGLIGSLFTSSSIPTWYAAINRPSLSPPNWVFGPVWTTLFILMGIGFYLVWKKWAVLPWTKRQKRLALVLFGVQLVLNTLWSIIFFGLQNPGGALIEIVFLWLAIAATIITFAKISRPAAWLLVPYILWVSFASYLNYAIWTLN